jgi:ribosomal protein L16 Arg81 hydroxylase
MTFPSSFENIIAPISPEEFFSEYYGKKHLHIKAAENQFSHIMNWEKLNAILNMSDIWSQHSLRLVLDKQPINPNLYSSEFTNRDNQKLLKPHAEKVSSFLQAGASLVLNSIQSLSPELQNISQILEKSLNAKSQANLYCSWRQRQAFASHFDTHDVFAIHFEGTKVWQIYEGFYPNPINHAAFKSLPREYHEKQKGSTLQEVELNPGDLLYIPRGLYHDALAASSGVIHIAFGMTSLIGLDALETLQGLSLQDPSFRKNLPLPQENNNDLKAYVKSFSESLNAIIDSDAFFNTLKEQQKQFLPTTHNFSLPINPDDGLFNVTQGLSLKKDPNNPQVDTLVTHKGNIPIPPQFVPLMAFIVSKSICSRKDISNAAQNLTQEQIEQFLHDIRAMNIISPHIPS